MTTRQTNVRIPNLLRDRIDKDAQKQSCTIQAVILQILGEHYRLTISEPHRGRKPAEPVPFARKPKRASGSKTAAGR